MGVALMLLSVVILIDAVVLGCAVVGSPVIIAIIIVVGCAVLVELGATGAHVRGKSGWPHPWLSGTIASVIYPVVAAWRTDQRRCYQLPAPGSGARPTAVATVDTNQPRRK